MIGFRSDKKRSAVRGVRSGARNEKNRRATRKAQMHARKSAKTSTNQSAERVLAAVMRIPKGKVSTYGGIAEVAGLPRRARLVGTVLRRTPSSRGVPWFRVINASGRISFPIGSDAYLRQRKKLETEGVMFVSGRVDLARFGWPATVASLDEFLWKPSDL
jgi:methylated-DNA-protein-cysteine methyltransferase-like protein